MAISRRLAAAPRKTRRRFWFGALLAAVGIVVASLALTAGSSGDHRPSYSAPTSQSAAPGVSPADFALSKALEQMQSAAEQVHGNEDALLAYLASAEDYLRIAQNDLQQSGDDNGGGLSTYSVASSSGSDSDLPAVLTAVGGLIAALAGLLTAGLSWRRAAAPALPVPAP